MRISRDIIFKVIYLIKIETFGCEQTEKVGESLGAALPQGSVVALFGDLGAGKTAFTRGFVRGAGIDAHVSSPTFSLVNEYTTGKKSVCHFDMYRITSCDDLYSTGYFDYLDAGSTLIIEWSENIVNDLPDDCIKVNIIKSGDENHRILEISGCDGIEITCG